MNASITFLIFGLPGGPEWILVLIAIILLFGGKKIPEMMKGLGQGMKEFKNAREGNDSEKKENEPKS